MADWRLHDAEFEVTNPRTTGKQLWIPQGSLTVTETAGVITMKRRYVEHDVPAETIRLVNEFLCTASNIGHLSPRAAILSGIDLPRD